MSNKILMILKFIILIVLIVCLSLLHVSSEQMYSRGETLNKIPSLENQLNNIQKGGNYVS